MEPATKRRKLSNTGERPDDDGTTVATSQDKRQSLFVRSLPASVTKERLIEHFSQSYPLKHATIVLDPQTKISRGFGFVTFTDAEDAQQALAEFNNSVLDGRKIKVEAAEARHREVDENVEGKTSSTNTKGEELRAKRQQQQEDNQPPKLIVRNLPWSIKTADDLSKLFLSYGKVKHAVVPTLPTNKDAQAGFGIVIIRGKKNAEMALAGVNGKVVDGRTLAVDWAVDKETWQKVRKAEFEQEDGNKPEPPVDELDSGKRLTETATSDDEADDDGGALLGGEDSVLNDGAEDSSDEPEQEEENDEEADDASLDAGDIADLAAEDETEATSSSKFNTENTTVFIRNLPYDTDDETLFEHFTTHFGPIRYARVVFDHETERPRGTAFVCFRHEDDAKSCVKDCPKQDLAVVSDNKFNKHQQPSILQNTNADPTGKYTLNSRVLHITRALPKPEADRRADEGKNTRLAKQTTDKRRLYLLSEGTVSPGSTLYNSLSKAELDIRASSAKQRQKLVKTNPNLGLSLSRLSIRNLPRWLDAKALKALAREAIVGFASDVKTGHRQAVSKEELARDGEAGRLAEKQRKEQGKGVVKQAKIVYESELSGGKVGEGKGGRSRGYGFIEYWGHRSALMGLRWLNGHLVKKPKDIKEADDDGEKGKRLIVEFAIENAQVVQRRGERERRVKDRQSRDEAGGEVEQRDDRRNDRKRKDGGRNGRDRNDKNRNGRDGSDKNRNGRDRNDRGNDRGQKRKRDGDDSGDRSRPKVQKKDTASKDAKIDPKDQDEKNKVAARNRVIAQKRQKRRNRKG